MAVGAVQHPLGGPALEALVVAGRLGEVWVG